MAKKKSMTTMTLREFHGGSIPSDLPLPSAPGISAKPSLERNASASLRSDRRPNVSSSPSSFLPLPVSSRMIGRHFDEDERTPFDAPPQRPHMSIPTATGAWANRKDHSNLATSPNPGPTVWSPSKVAQASAVEKVISGRWHSSSKPDVPAPLVVQNMIESPVDQVKRVGSGHESETNLNPLITAHGSGFERPVARSGVIGDNRVKSPVTSVIPTETKQVGSGLEDFHPFGPSKKQGHYGNWNERPRSGGLVEGNEKARSLISAVDFDQRPVSHDGVERPRLKLLPRSKPVENVEIKIRVSEEKSIAILGNEISGNEGGIEGNERPRLNLKPRSQSDEAVGNIKRPSVFGGARPRELVLKERGVDEISEEPDKILPSTRPKSSTSKPDPTGDRSNNTRNPNWQQHQPDTQWTNRRVPHQQRPEPDTWRKPEVPAKQETITVPRVGKGATALEMAQAFSKQASDTGTKDPVRRTENTVLFSRLLGGERVTGYNNNRSPHQQINGY